MPRLALCCMAAGGLSMMALSTSGLANEDAPRLSGIYSSVEFSPESGDLGGLEIELHADSPRPFAIVVFCEGWCNQAYRVPAKVDGRNFELTFSEQYFDSSGKAVGVNDYHLAGRLEGSAVRVDFQLNEFKERLRLQRRQARFGLDVARPPVEQDRP